MAAVGAEVSPRRLRPASAGDSPWRNAGRLRMRDVERIRTSAKYSQKPLRPSSAPSQKASQNVSHLRDAPSSSEILSKAYAQRMDTGHMQYQMKFEPKAHQKAEEAETIEVCYSCNALYMGKCQELRVKANSGILALLSSRKSCLCQQEGGSFRNMLLGNRGILGVLPLWDSMKALKNLSLIGNGLRDAGMQAVLKALKAQDQLPQLCVFDLSHNPLSPSSGDDLGPLLGNRKRLLLMGVEGTALGSIQRQRLLKQTLRKFEECEGSDAVEAWRLATSSGFADGQVTAWCAGHAEALGALPRPESPRAVPLPPKAPRPPSAQAPRARKAAAFSAAKLTPQLCTSKGENEKCAGPCCTPLTSSPSILGEIQ